MTPDAVASAASRYADTPEEAAALAERILERHAFRLRRGHKVCSSCHEALPVSAFGRDASRGDGLEVRCRPCRTVATPEALS